MRIAGKAAADAGVREKRTVDRSGPIWRSRCLSVFDYHPCRRLQNFELQLEKMLTIE